MKNTYSMLLMLAVFVLASCSVADEPVVVTDDKSLFYDSEIDYSVNPGDDFYKYALGQWLNSSNPSPSLMKDIDRVLVEIGNSMFTNSTNPLVAQLRSQAGETIIDDNKNKMLLNERLQMLEQVETADQLFDAFKTLYDLGYSPLCRILPDFAIGRHIVTSIATGGMSMEMIYAMDDKDEEKVTSLVDKYCQYLGAFGFSDERIAQIIGNATLLELQEMNAYVSGYELYPPQLEVGKTRATDADDIEPIIRPVLAVMGIDDTDYANGNVEFSSQEVYDILFQFASVGDDQNEINAFRDYLIYNVMAQDAQFIPSVNKEATQLDMMKSALHYNRYYLYRLNTEYFGYDNINKQQCSDIMERMRQIFLQRLDKLDWMTDATKALARKKAEAMDFYIGYPDKWNEDYTPSVDGDCMLASATQLRQNAFAKISVMRRKSYDEAAWEVLMNLYTFNVDAAYTDYYSNSLVILPSNIMKPYYNIDLSDATIYAVAYWFGHEFSHGFDSEGSDYDEYGNKIVWWAPADKAAFQAKQQQMIELYNQLEVIPGLYANGATSLDENIADFGGVELALACYKELLKEQGFKGAQFDEQLKKFFLSYAQLLKHESELSQERLVEKSKNEAYSVFHNRVNGVLRLIDDWYRVFNVKPTDKLYVSPENRVKIW